MLRQYLTLLKFTVSIKRISLYILLRTVLLFETPSLVTRGLYSSEVFHRTDSSSKDLDSNIPDIKQKSVTINHDSDVSKILIVDNIEESLDFSSSRRILQEIHVHMYFPSVKIEFAYSLAKGGIAIHTTCEKDRDLLLTGLPAESFGRGIKHLPKGFRDYSVFVKGVDTTVEVSQLVRL